MSVFDNTGHILTPAEIYKLCETKDGKKQVQIYILRARTAYCIHNLLDSLGVVPPVEKQQELCEILWQTMFGVDLDDIMAWIDELGEFRSRDREWEESLPLC